MVRYAQPSTRFWSRSVRRSPARKRYSKVEVHDAYTRSQAHAGRQVQRSLESVRRSGLGDNRCHSYRDGRTNDLYAQEAHRLEVFRPRALAPALASPTSAIHRARFAGSQPYDKSTRLYRSWCAPSSVCSPLSANACLRATTPPLFPRHCAVPCVAASLTHTGPPQGRKKDRLGAPLVAPSVGEGGAR